MLFGTWLDWFKIKMLKVSVMSAMHFNSRHVVFIMTACFHFKPVHMDISLQQLFLKGGKSVYFNNEYSLKSHIPVKYFLKSHNTCKWIIFQDDHFI